MLTPERWQRVESLFDGALDRDPADREAWLVAQCAGDPELLDEVRELLAASEDAGERFERPAAVEAAHLVVDGLRDPFEGKALGPYHLAEEIGRGGMGVVYRAERRDGHFQQDVVVKLLRVGIDGEAGRDRLRRERQILAQLAHENIARLFDGGVAPDGRPYIVMEPVDGLRIDLWCDRRRATIRHRLELFLQVIDAVQYAHRNLVVHRDLKPANVLVTDEGQVKLLDFGIAKILDDDEVGGTQTQHGLMTPDYASPEQIRGQRITVASDVYQLGVLLFELLTGFLPYDLGSRSLFDVSRAVCETEPVFPSRVYARATTGRTPSRPSTVEDDRDPQRMLAARGTDATRLARSLAGDLDGIVLKALQKDPADRYDSARALGDDIRRHLEGRPILARESDVGYRVRKALRRHAAALTTAAAVLAIVVGSGFFHTQRVTSERNRAQREAAEKQEIADFLVEMFEVSDASKVSGAEVTASELVQRALDRIGVEDRSPRVEARMLLAIGEVGTKLGLNEELRPALERAVELTAEEHGPRSSEHADALVALANNHRLVRQLEEARPLLDQAVSIQRTMDDRVRYARSLRLLAEVRRDTGDPERALDDIEEALAILRDRFPADSNDVLMALGTQAYIYRTLERHREAEALYREVIAAQRAMDEPPAGDLATQLNNLGFLLTRDGRDAEAVPIYEEATRLQTTHAGEDHPTTMAFRGNLVGALTRSGRYEEAIETMRENIELKRARHGDTHWSVGQSEHGLGSVLLQADRLDEAERAFRRASAIFERDLGPDHAWTAGERLWVATMRLLQGDADAFERAVDADLDTTFAGMGNSVVAARYESLVKTLAERGHRDRAEALEARRMELRAQRQAARTSED